MNNKVVEDKLELTEEFNCYGTNVADHKATETTTERSCMKR